MKAFLIDFDGVVRMWDEAELSAIEEEVGLPGSAIATAAFSADLLFPAVLGHVQDEEWRRLIARQLQRSFPDADARRAVELWSALPGKLNRQVLEIIGEVRTRGPVVLVTNGTTRLPVDLGRLGLLHEFDALINSSVVGAAKPDVKIFEAALEWAKVSAKHAFFTDDNPRHVNGAITLGIRAEVFRRADELRRYLTKVGMLPV